MVRGLDWYLSQPGFDPSYGKLVCLTTLMNSDRTKQICLWMTIYIYILKSLGEIEVIIIFEFCPTKTKEPNLPYFLLGHLQSTTNLPYLLKQALKSESCFTPRLLAHQHQRAKSAFLLSQVTQPLHVVFPYLRIARGFEFSFPSPKSNALPKLKSPVCLIFIEL